MLLQWTKSDQSRMDPAHGSEKAVANYNFLDKDVQEGFSYRNIAVLKPNDIKSNFDIVEMQWGFLPSYLKTAGDVENMRRGYKDSNGKFHPPLTTRNATSEEMLKPGKMYRDAALHRRCLILSTGFFEWRHIFPKNKRTGEPLKTAVKYPYHISVKDVPYFYMAGIWQPWTDRRTGETIETVAIITTRANHLMEQVHNSKMRMPTILNDEQAWEWMMDDISEDRIAELATFVYPDVLMEACTIDKEFRKAVEPTKEYSYEDLPALELSL